MKVLGISCYYHDAAACIMENGKIIAAAEEERFSRKKHDSDFPRQAIDFCLNEAGLEITAASGSNLGGSIGGALKFAFVDDEEIAFGPILRMQYFWSNNIEMGFSGNRTFYGGGAFLHYRFLDWFYLGSEVEMNQAINTFNNPSRRWSPAVFIGGGIHKQLSPKISLNAGMLYDVADALRDPITSNPSAFSLGYFLQRNNPATPNQGGGGYFPIIARVTFFFPLYF